MEKDKRAQNSTLSTTNENGDWIKWTH